MIPIFTGSSITYTVDEFLRRFNDLANDCGLSSEEKFNRVFDYIDTSLESVLSIIRTCSYNDWPTFERMLHTAYLTDSQGLPYVQHLIKTFQDKTSGFGINVFLECFFAYTGTLCRQGLMSHGQRFSLLTFALPPSYINFLRKYSAEANEWLSGMPSDVPTSSAKWARLIDLTKQFAVDQEMCMPAPPGRSSRGRGHRRKQSAHRHTPECSREPTPPLPPPPVFQAPLVPPPTTDMHSAYGYLSAHQLDTAFLKASHDLSANPYIRHTVESAPSSVASPSIISTPSEYLTQLGSSSMVRGQTSAESVRNYAAMTRTRRLSNSQYQYPSHAQPADAPTVMTKNQQARASVGTASSPTTTSQQTQSSRSSATANTLYTMMSCADAINTRSTTPIQTGLHDHADAEKDEAGAKATATAIGSNFFFDIISEYCSSTGVTTNTSPQQRRPQTADEKERRVWELFLRANQKVQPGSAVTQAGGAKTSQKRGCWPDESAPDEDTLYNIDEILASRLEDDDESTSSSGFSRGSAAHPAIPVDIIMRQFMDPSLTAVQERRLVETYAATITCYRMSAFVSYPEDLLSHVFEMVLQYTYDNERILSKNELIVY